MEDLPDNSEKAKTTRVVRKTTVEASTAKQIDPVVRGSVTRKKVPLGRKVKESLLGGSDAKTVWGFVLFDVVVPAARDLIFDAAQESMQRIIYPDGGAPSRRGRSGRGPRSDTHTSYGAISTSRRRDPRREISRTTRSRHDFDDIELDTRVEAEEVIDNLYNLLEKYELVTVADLYKLLDIEPSFVDAKWGWDDLGGAGVSRSRNGRYLLNLPSPEPVRD